VAKWTVAYINSLPDSSFLYIESGGEKDEEDKTTPRSLRHLPYKDANGAVDLDHVRNTLSRLDQTKGIPDAEKEKIRAKCQKILDDQKQTDSKLSRELLSRGVLRITPLTLDASGALPTRIPLFITGNWPNSIKGNFSVSLDDLKEIKQHFDAGIGFPTEDAATGLAIDFMHEYDGPAAAWIRGLDLVADESTGQATLYADPVEWTDQGKSAINGGMFKCISPMGAFGRHDGQPTMWQSVTDLTRQLANVLEGAGLTNIPFLQGMAPIMASRLPDTGQLDASGMVFVSDNDNNEEIRMNLDELRLKEKTALSADELKHLEENKDKLSADERVKFGFEAAAPAPAPAPAPAETLSAEDKAKILSGNARRLLKLK